MKAACGTGRSGWPARGVTCIAVVGLLALAGCGGEEGPAAERAAGPDGSGSPGTDQASLPPIAGGTAPLEPATAASGQLPDRFGFGQPADSAEIARLDIDVLPDGTGLPPGSGSVSEGAEVYRTQCASCHGPTGRSGAFGALVSPPGERDFLAGRDPSVPTTIGNYWPHATTIFEYVARAMPMQDPGTLSDDEVYAVVAWLLHENGLVEEDAVMGPESLPAVEMPGQGRFIMDDRSGGSEIR